MQKSIKKIGTVAALALFGMLVIGCSDSTTGPDDSGTVEQPDQVNITERVPDTLQTTAPRAYSGIASVQTYMNLGHNMYGSINQQYSTSGGTYTYGDLTIVYSAEPETRNGLEGTSWSITYDGSISSNDTTITFNDETIFSGWTANDGSAGEFTWDFGAYARANNSTEGEDNLYIVNWSTDASGTLTANTTIQADGETIEYTIVLNEDGSGSYDYTYTDADGSEETFATEWDVDGQVMSNG